MNGISVKKIVRYGSISLWLIMGFALAFMVFDLREKSGFNITKEKAALKKSLFLYRTSMDLVIDSNTPEADIEPYIKKFVKRLREDSEVITAFISLYKPGSAKMERGSVCIAKKPPKYPLHKGYYPTSEQLQNGDGYAVVAYSRKNDVYVRDGREYIDFCGMAFEVTGYLDNHAAWLVEYGAIFFCNDNTEALWDCMAARYLKDGRLYLVCESDKTLDYESSFEELNGYMNSISDGQIYIESIHNIESYKVGMANEDMSRRLNDLQMSYVVSIYCFLIVVLIFIVEYWFLMVQKEFLIMTKNGMLLSGVICHILKWIGIYAVLGAVVGKIINCMLEYRYYGYLDAAYVGFDYSMNTLLKFIVITGLLTMSFPIVKLLVKYKKGKI